jgi:hypothetical protein
MSLSPASSASRCACLPDSVFPVPFFPEKSFSMPKAPVVKSDCVHGSRMSVCAQLPVKMVRAGQHATVATHPSEDVPQAQMRPAAQPSRSATAGMQEAAPASVAPGQAGPPTDKREVFRIPLPCGEQGTPLLRPQGNQRLTHPDKDNGAHHSAPTLDTLGNPQTAKAEDNRAAGSSTGKHLGIQSVFKNCQNGSAASLPGVGMGMMEGFGVGSSALEYAQPEEFGGLQIEWAAERSRWALRSHSAPSLAASSASNSRKVHLPHFSCTLLRHTFIFQLLRHV